jgi:hypothetical protein
VAIGAVAVIDRPGVPGVLGARFIQGEQGVGAPGKERGHGGLYRHAVLHEALHELAAEILGN